MNLHDFGDGSNVFFTSDTHFYHENIIKFCKRPYDNVLMMNEALIKNWNDKVGKNDIVFHLGDFCWGGSPKWREILEQLNGHIYLIRGNHDDKNLKDNVSQYFKHITYQMKIKIDKHEVYLNHYPFLCYHGFNRLDIFALHGHVHHSIGGTGIDEERLVYEFSNQYDVGVDANNYAPISWEELKIRVNKQIQLNLNMMQLDELNKI